MHVKPMTQLKNHVKTISCHSNNFCIGFFPSMACFSSSLVSSGEEFSSGSKRASIPSTGRIPRPLMDMLQRHFAGTCGPRPCVSFYFLLCRNITPSYSPSPGLGRLPFKESGPYSYSLHLLGLHWLKHKWEHRGGLVSIEKIVQNWFLRGFSGFQEIPSILGS